MFEPTEVPAPSFLERLRDFIVATVTGGWAGVGTEGFKQILGFVWKSQQDEFIESLARQFQIFEKYQLTIEDVFSNPRFREAAYSAAKAAAGICREEKREALRNAVINSALPGSPSADLQQIFIGYVEQLTPFHLKMLKVFVERLSQTRNAYTESRRLHEVLREHHPELLSGGLLDLVCEDLVARGLVSKSSGGRGGWAQETMGLIVATGFGQEFLKFVSAPEVR